MRLSWDGFDSAAAGEAGAAAAAAGAGAAAAGLPVGFVPLTLLSARLRLRLLDRCSRRSGLGCSRWPCCGPVGGVSSPPPPPSLSAVSLAFLASRFFLFFAADLDNFSSAAVPSAPGGRATPPPGAAPGGTNSTGSAPGTSRLLGLPNPLMDAAPKDEDPPSRLKAAPPSSSRLNARDVVCPRAPGGRYAPTGLDGTFFLAR